MVKRGGTVGWAASAICAAERKKEPKKGAMKVERLGRMIASASVAAVSPVSTAV